MSDDPQGQVSASAAEVYEAFFVPALFRQWAPRMADAARLAPGDAVLDVACGTGVVAREAAQRVAPSGSVTGLDLNPDMLAVARRLAPDLEWRQGSAEALPFADAGFDAVCCQFALMFFRDRAAALGEMRRVLRPGGRAAVAVWDRVEHSPGYAAMVELLENLFGGPIADELRAPFVLGDADALRPLFEAAGFADVAVRTEDGMARFPSIHAWVETDVKGWTLADLIDEDQYGRLQREAARALARFAADDGTVAFACPAHIVAARAP